MFFLCFISCKRENTFIKNKTMDTIAQIDSVPIHYKFDFPDTVYVNEKYNGRLYYESVYDSITTVFENKEKDRYVLLSMLITNSIDYDLSHLLNKVKDTFGAVDNRVIPLRDISFPKQGVFYIDGIINDGVYIDLQRKDEKGDNLLRWLELNVRATKKVVVIDKDVIK